MKNCQENKKIVIFYAVFMLFFIFIPSKHLSAAGDTGLGGFDANGVGTITGLMGGEKSCSLMSQKDAAAQQGYAKTAGTAITVSDTTVQGLQNKLVCIDTRNGVERTMDQIKSWAIDKALVELKNSGDIAWRQTLKFFLNTLAYDTATYLATGDKGQMPMFETQGWGGYLKNIADDTAGNFIQNLGSNMKTIKFNLCQPNFNVLLKINLGLSKTYRPTAPACTFSKMIDNWDAALKDKDFLPKFQDMFNPWSNDLGIALTLQTGIESEISKNVNTATQDRIEGKGWRPVRSAIEGRIMTPADTVGSAARQPILDSTASEKIHTGTILADSIDIFINTLAGKLMDKWLKKGLVTNFPASMSSLSDINAQNESEGITGAENRNRSLVEPNFKVRGDYEILAELTMCPDPNKAGPTNCVIDEKFRQAIEKRLTVGQAMAQGYLNSNGVFGFTSDGLEPKFNEGYPYRSMLILRKFRILPVGWEVAAQKIKDLQGLHCSVDGNSCTTDANCSQSPNPQICAGVGGTKNLNDLVNCSAAWCKDLVDPNWVLKAPQNFCAREGAGPEILSEQITGEGTASSLSILRNDTYCADEQSLIKENSDGSDPKYGYCTEERRIWDFNGKSCEPRDNTCQTFNGPDNQTVSYLKNTLDYSFCNLGNAGCQKYATSSLSYSGGVVAWNKTGGIYFNKNVESCEAADEGCHQFIRLNPGGGANLLINAGFEQPLTEDDWLKSGVAFGVLNDDAYQGKKSLKMTSAKSREIKVGTADYNIAGESYALSFYAKGCGLGNSFSLGDKTADLTQSSDWQRYDLAYAYPDTISANANIVEFSINSSSCLIDNIKLERGSAATGYSDYAVGPSLIYEKLLPDYLMDDCYEDKGDYYQAQSDAPARCSNYARQCQEAEAGCELYTNVNDGSKIPAKAKFKDYCPAACVGYNSFIQQATNFDSSREAYFIPKNGKACGAEASGCDEFTNLEKLATTTPNLAEKKEYYSYLRQCLKPSQNECGEFYSWEGSDESGYQLKVQSLASTVAGDNAEPLLTTGAYNPAVDDAKCSPDIYNSPVGDPRHNDDCRQFYNRAGEVYYRLYSKTKDCAEDCHPYRRTEVNIDTSISQADCPNSDPDKHWDSANGQCAVCKSGGVWNADNNACIYMATPNQSKTCSAAQNGCREYTGNTGNDVRNIFVDDFSGGTFNGWLGGGNATVQSSSDSLMLSPDNKGTSINIYHITGYTSSLYNAKRPVGSAVSQGKAYVLSFLAKASSPTDLNLSLINANRAEASFAKVALGADWQIYKTSLANLNHLATSSEYLFLKANQSFYIDSITLTEIVDRYYLIKNLWNTPAACDEDESGAPHDLYMLGCDQYADRANKTHYLKSFSELCSESAVGCELVIDTKNSSNPGASYYKDGQLSNAAAGPDITVPPDSYNYVVYDKDKLCHSGAKGCSMLGQAYQYAGAAAYGDVFLKNNPDKYDTTLCGASAVGCQTFVYNDGVKSKETNFKDPGDLTCEYRRQAGAGESAGWFKKKIKRCVGEVSATGGSGNIDNIGTVDSDDLKIINDYINSQINLADDKYNRADVNGDGLVDELDAKAIAELSAHTATLVEARKKYSAGGVCLSDANCSVITGKENIKCAKDADCGDKNKCLKPAGETKGVCRYACVIDNNDYKCQTSEDKTFGLGGAGGRVSQPKKDNKDTLADLNDDVNWAGICSAANSGCGEYIDPVSKFNNNLIFNGGFQKLAVNNWDGWEAVGGDYKQNVTLEPNTVYRLATEKTTSGSPVSLTLDCVKNNHLLNVIGKNNLLSLSSATGIITVTAAEDRNSQIFYYKGGTAASCEITAGDSAGVVELKKAVIDYQLAQNLDSSNCNGVVDFNKGCVLFNERSQEGKILKPLDSDADVPTFGSASRDGEEDANVILKVTPDRVCDKWLAPRSYIKDEKENNMVYDIGLCDALDENNDCSSFITSKKINQTMGTATGQLDAAKISNLSGYAKVGINGGSLVSDYYPFGAMEQTGEVVNLANGGFEFYGANLYPVGWSWGGQNKSWDANVFSVINNPISAQSEGIGNAPEGRAFIKLGSTYIAESEEIDVMPNTEYIITAYINTKNLKSGQAKIDVMGTDCPGNVCPVIASSIIWQEIGNDWQFKVGKFKTGAGSNIKIKLFAPGAVGMPGSEGNFYFDDIKIRPALNSRYNTALTNEWYTTQSCRLYNKTDSLSCDYYEDSGNRMKGWPGYCLEYDRAPGNPNACILWYPVDKVKGDGIEEGAGYQGKAPVYYCTEAKALIPVEYRQARFLFSKSSDWSDNWCQGCYAGSSNYSSSGRVIGNDCYCAPDKGDCLAECNFIKGSSAPGWKPDGWYKYDGSFQEAEAKKGIKFYDPVTQKLFDDTFAYCSKIVQTVNSIGDNKFWASRVYKGTDWKVWFNSIPPPPPAPQPAYGYYQYGTDGAPFGSIMAPTSNPYDWDGFIDAGIQPLLVKRPSSGEARASSPFMMDTLSVSSFPTGSYYGTCENTGSLCLHVGGIDSTAASSSYEMNKADCAPGEGACKSVNFSGEPEGPVDKLKTLFAKSYGAWQWGASGDYKCSAGSTDNLNNSRTGSLCLGQPNQCPKGKCEFASKDDKYCDGTPPQSCDVVSCPDNDCTAINLGYSTCGGTAGGQKCCAPDQVCKPSIATVYKCSAGSSNAGTICTDQSSQYCGNGVCEFKGDNNLRYITDTAAAANWKLPEQKCKDTSNNNMSSRSNDVTKYLNSNDYCAIIPTVTNVKVNGLSSNVTLSKNGFVNLTFNSQADSNQLPLTMYAVEWGDGESTTVTGVEMRDRPNADVPHSLYHLYGYWDLKAKANQNQCPGGSCSSASLTCVGGNDNGKSCVDCTTAGECKVRPKVQIKDNWGWCNKGTETDANVKINSCTVKQWQNFPAEVIVTEK